ncbi:MAG: hypothetical protein AAGA15_01700 [Pseudomonadota bacterium]
MDPALAEFLKSYAAVLTLLRGLATAVFGACLFLVVRQVGIIRDPDLRGRPLLIPILLSGSSAALALVAAVFVQGSLASLHDDLYQAAYLPDVAPAQNASAEIRDDYAAKLDRLSCTSEWTGQPIDLTALVTDRAGISHYFDQCLRGGIAFWVQLTLAATVISVAFLLLWFILQIIHIQKVLSRGSIIRAKE